MNNLLRYFALRNLATRPLRTLLTIVGIALGISLFSAIQLINQAIFQQVAKNFAELSGNSQITITAREAGIPEERLQELEETEGVKSAVPLIESRAHFPGKTESETLVILGVDLLRDGNVRSYKFENESVIEDPLIFFNQPDSILVSRDLANRRGLMLDGKFTLVTSVGVKTFTVRGILESEGIARAYGGSLAIMDIDGARMSFGKVGRIDRIDLAVRSSAKVEDVLARVRARLGPAYSVETPENELANTARLLSSYEMLLTFMGSLAILVGLFMIANTISFAVAEYRKEIGISRALGASRGGILFVFLATATFMGFLGACLGTACGGYLAGKIVGLVTESMSAQHQARISVPKVLLTFPAALATIALGTITSLVAAFWPAYKATLVAPITAIRDTQDVGFDENSQVRHFQRLFLFGLLAVAVYGCLLLANLGSGKPALELASQISLMAGISACVPLLTLEFVIFLRNRSAAFTATIVKLALNNLLKNPKRTSANVLSLMMGLMIVILLAAIKLSLSESIRAWTERTLVADIFISSYEENQTMAGVPLHEDILDEIVRLPETNSVLRGRPFALRLVKTEYQGEPMTLKAIDPLAFPEQYSFIDLIAGDTREIVPRLFAPGKYFVFISKTFANAHKVKANDAIALETPRGPVKFTVLGIVHDYSAAGGVVYLSRPVLRELWNDRLVNAICLELTDKTKIPEVQRELDRNLGMSRNVVVRLNSELKTEILRSVDRGFAYTRAIEIAAVLIAVLMLVNTLYVSIMERIREIAFLRALGMSRAQLYLATLLEAALYGLTASVLALLFSAGNAYLWVRFSLETFLGWSVDFYFPTLVAAGTLVLGVVVAALAGLLPAYRAVNADIKKAMTYE